MAVRSATTFRTLAAALIASVARATTVALVDGFTELGVVAIAVMPAATASVATADAYAA